MKKILIYPFIMMLILCSVTAQEIFSDTVMGANSCDVDTVSESILISGMTILVFSVFITLLFIKIEPLFLIPLSLVFFFYSGHTYACFRLASVISICMGVVTATRGLFGNG